MRTINKVILLGNLGADVELRYTDAGKAVGKLSLATRHARKLDDGSWEELVDWHKVVTFGTLAERCSTYLSKGSGVVVEGRLSARSFEDKEGQRRRVQEVIATDVLFLPRRAPVPGEGVALESSGGSREEGPPAAEADVPF